MLRVCRQQSSDPSLNAFLQSNERGGPQAYASSGFEAAKDAIVHDAVILRLLVEVPAIDQTQVSFPQPTTLTLVRRSRLTLGQWWVVGVHFQREIDGRRAWTM